MVDHYKLANGRAIVHLLDSFFLSINISWWRIFNSAMLAGIVYFGIKISAYNRKETIPYITSGLIFLSGICFLDIKIIRQSIYWITGSFNYVYPMFMLFAYWYFLKIFIDTNKHFKTTIILAFLASATVEQVGMMVFGLTVLTITTRIIFKKEFPKKVYILLLISLIAVSTVLLSPSQFVRLELETKSDISFEESAKKCIEYMNDLFIYSDELLIYRNFFLAVTIIFFISICFCKNNQNIKKWYKNHDYTNIPISLILFAGSQIMMIVSPVYGYRNNLCGIFMIILYCSSIASNIYICKNLIIKIIYYIFGLFILFISANNIQKISYGYKKSYEIFEKNIDYINKYNLQKRNDTLTLYKLEDDNYGWSMPYYSEYHLEWFKKYYNIDYDINWK